MLHPTVIIPADQVATNPRMHLGAAFDGPVTIDANCLQVMPGDDVPGSDTDYWVFDVGVWDASAWHSIVVVTTQTQGSGGVDAMQGGRWRPLQHQSSGGGANSVLAVRATAVGNPNRACFAFGLLPS